MAGIILLNSRKEYFMKLAIVSLLSILSLTIPTHAAESGFNCQDAYSSVVIKNKGSKLLGLYNSDHGQIPLICKKVNKQVGELILRYKCIEARTGGGRIVVEVSGGGMTGQIQASVFQEQMYPLPPQVLETVHCVL